MTARWVRPQWKAAVKGLISPRCLRNQTHWRQSRQLTGNDIEKHNVFTQSTRPCQLLTPDSKNISPICSMNKRDNLNDTDYKQFWFQTIKLMCQCRFTVFHSLTPFCLYKQKLVKLQIHTIHFTHTFILRFHTLIHMSLFPLKLSIYGDRWFTHYLT